MPHEDAFVPAASASRFSSLAKLKDRIIAFFRASQLDDSTKNMWCDDANGMYFHVVNADMRLSQGRDSEACRGMLYGASSRFEQVASELRALGEEGLRLEEELKQTFATCHAALSARIPAIVVPATTPARVLKHAAEDYVLPCSVCGKQAVAVHLAGADEKILKGIICAGIIRAVGIDPKDKARIFGWLEKGDLAALHHYLESERDVDGGLDAYCPQCDLIYCQTHYNVTERWDEGFYDCAYGTCPHGHEREVDD
jgi:hypothetical protein